jgi:hypothetical protein
MQFHIREELIVLAPDSPTLPLYDGGSTLPVINRAFLAGDRSGASLFHVL